MATALKKETAAKLLQLLHDKREDTPPITTFPNYNNLQFVFIEGEVPTSSLESSESSSEVSSSSSSEESSESFDSSYVTGEGGTPCDYEGLDCPENLYCCVQANFAPYWFGSCILVLFDEGCCEAGCAVEWDGTIPGEMGGDITFNVCGNGTQIVQFDSAYFGTVAWYNVSFDWSGDTLNYSQGNFEDAFFMTVSTSPIDCGALSSSSSSGGG